MAKITRLEWQLKRWGFPDVIMTSI
jgi:hypothetical protein